MIIPQARTANVLATPNLMAVSGQYDYEFRIALATREGSVCMLRRGWLEGKPMFHMDRPVIGLSLLPTDQTNLIICADQSLDCYSKKGKRLWGVNLPEAAVCMETITLTHVGQTLICVALRGGLVQIYLNKVVVDHFNVAETVTAMTFGRLGQEDHVLVLITIGIFYRSFPEFSIFSSLLLNSTFVIIPTEILFDHCRRLTGHQNSQANGWVQDRNYWLQWSITRTIWCTTNTEENQGFYRANDSRTWKCSRYSWLSQNVSSYQRRNDANFYHFEAIYNSFLTELWRLRLVAARETVEVINSAESAISGDIGQTPIKLSAEVCGLGPVFQIDLTIVNMSAKKVASDLRVLIHADQRHYLLKSSYRKVSALVYLRLIVESRTWMRIWELIDFCRAVAFYSSRSTTESELYCDRRRWPWRWVTTVWSYTWNGERPCHGCKGRTGKSWLRCFIHLGISNLEIFHPPSRQNQF